MLYRAYVYPQFTLSDEPQRETLVFFQCDRNQSPSERLRQLVAAAWNTQPALIDFYNLTSEDEHRAMWAPQPGQPALPGHAWLLQTGDGPTGPTFADPLRTQLLCGPIWHDRLVQAQRTVVALQMAALAGALATHQQATATQAAAAQPASGTRITGVRTPVPLDQLADRREWRNHAMGL
jgi:hypothetical protein